MHRQEKLKQLLWKLEKKGISRFTSTEFINFANKELKVTPATAGRYLQEMVSWNLVKREGFIFINDFCKKNVEEVNKEV